MRVRPIFWCLLALACAGVLLFAGTVHRPVPAVMQLHLTQTLPTPGGFEARIELHLSDAQGLPIDQAQSQVFIQGDGSYNVLVPLSMAGPWAIHIAAEALGFDTQQQTLLLQVA